ncbi:Uncharacterized protein QTN25_003303 [Entamoeba marina]
MNTSSNNIYAMIPMLPKSDKRKVKPRLAKLEKKWELEEDRLLLKAVEKYGNTRWRLVSQEVPYRTRKQCRDRYNTTLDPKLYKQTFQTTEHFLLTLHELKETKQKEFGDRSTSAFRVVSNRFYSVEHFWSISDV